MAFLLYAYDAVRLLSPRELLLVEAGRGRLSPLIGDNPFASGGRVLAFGPLHLPYRGVFLATWGRPWADRVGVGAVLESMERLRGSLRMVRGLASLAFVLLFVAGPALTVTLGPDAAVVCVAAVLYPTVFAAIVAVWWRRHVFGFTTSRAVWLSVEILVCPAFVPNLVRKITIQQPLDVDAAQIVVATAAAGVGDDFLARLQTRTEAMIEAAAPDPTSQASLRTYLAALRSAR